MTSESVGAGVEGPAARPPTVRTTITEAAAVLEAASIDSSRVEAELLVAHVLGIGRGRIVAADPLTAVQRAALDTLLDRRVRHEPLQHITGVAPFGPIEVAVGPGVFTPRPETEWLLEWAVGECARCPTSPVVVDLCSGSGALAIAIATMVPTATVTAVERDGAALTWLRRNVQAVPESVARRITVLAGDVREAADVAGVRADVVVANPPYVPLGADLTPEVADHDPALALFGGADGMSVIVPMIDVIAEILTEGGHCAVEHDDTTRSLVVKAFARHGGFDAVTAHHDLAGRPRFVTARRAPIGPHRATTGDVRS